ncbi:MAG TPA: T9SS type A sorting domain-containing protein [bacterium]|jgi:hypothetical protein
MRRLFGTIFTAILLSMGLPVMLIAGGTHVSGDVSGVWPTGEVVFVDAPIFISPDKALVIEPGVRISFKTDAPFVISGSLSAVGSVDAPIVIEPMENWSGFQFLENGTSNIRVLRYVHISTEFGLPAYVVVATRSLLNIDDCDFRAHLSCLWMDGGRLWADRNSFLTTNQYSKAVRLNQLLNDGGSPCETGSAGNRMSENMIKVDADGDFNPGDDQMTMGLMVEGSTNTCFRGNVITVSAPGQVIGAYFGRTNDVGTDMWVLDYCVVTVRGSGAWAHGIFNANEGALRVIRCSVDVANIGGHDPMGVIASGIAQVMVNSCLVQVERGASYYVTLGGRASMDVDYSDQWRLPGSSDQPGNPPGGDGGGIGEWSEYSTQSIVYGNHVYFMDPNLRREGEWGQWHSMSDVQAYYGVAAPSPCIDNGDTVYCGWDPDRTLPDIGRYYYDEGVTGTDPQHHATLPVSAVLSPAFPNPFNATTVIPFELSRGGSVRVVVYDVLGREVAVLKSGMVLAGSHRVQFGGENLSSGLYIVTVQLDGVAVGSERAMLLK